MTNTLDGKTCKWHSLVLLGQGTIPVRTCSGKRAKNELQLLLRVAADLGKRERCDDLVSSLPE